MYLDDLGQIEVAIHAMRMAVAFHHQKNTELIETAVKSADTNHRIAAAWAFALQALPKAHQKIMVANFLRTQAVRLQLLARNGSTDPRIFRLAAGLNSFPSVEPQECQPHSNCILLLMRDKNPLVVSAARDACIAIACRKFNDNHVDFGPFYKAKPAAREDAALLWEIYLEKKSKDAAEPKPREREKEEAAKKEA